MREDMQRTELNGNYRCDVGGGGGSGLKEKIKTEKLKYYWFQYGFYLGMIGT